jgi:hypothetical protein
MSSACYALRYVKRSLPIETLKLIYFAHVHNIMSYGVLFWGNFSYANKVFILQKKIVRILLILDQGTLVGKRLGTCRYWPYIPSIFTQYYYSQSIISSCLLLIMKFMNTILKIITTFIPHQEIWQNSTRDHIQWVSRYSITSHNLQKP